MYNVRSVLEHGCPVWSPIIKDTHWNKLQSIQNQALRIATGNLAMAPIDHLHQETKVLPIRNHCEMVSKQFLAACHTPDHPGNKQLLKEKNKRKMKNTIVTMHEEEIANKFTTHQPTTEEYKNVIKIIHTESVANTINNYQNNKVLLRKPPEISTKEKELSRNTRVELSRLRSGYSRKLNSYMSRIDQEIQDRCPSCNFSPHNTEHLFNCPENPTELEAEDLWTKPDEAAEFLQFDVP